ncbi:hypothetical protein [Hyalangium gracile]|uniref:hypothetical protein n=1 Tax=Hyalangium gracile TaxID=394092 RepID=UPI001CCEADA5|nr:hypothetical protein [Hyalangium gracile]
MKELLGGPFPPDTLPGALSDDARAECVRRAKGKPGQTVEPGLFPRAEAKVARLLLAAAGYWEPNELLALAYACDSSERSHFKKSYHAHDAFACALVHPRISPEERARLITVVLAPDKSLRVGWRSRKSTKDAEACEESGYVFFRARCYAPALKSRRKPPPTSAPSDFR